MGKSTLHKTKGSSGSSDQQKAYAWHAHDFREALSLLHTSETGLSEEDVVKQRTLYGSNTFTEHPRPGIFSMFFNQIKSPLTAVLVVAFFITFVLEEYVDAGVIAFALLITVAVGIFQEGKASRAFEKLAEAQKRMATVIRSGKKHVLEASELVVGDVVVLQSGAQVPADIRLIKAKRLSVNEAALTGEWLAVDKSVESVSVGTPLAERSSMAFMGTYIAEGYGLGVVVEIGDKTALGQIIVDMQTVEESNTPLQSEMANLSRIMLYVIGVLVFLIFLVGIVQGQTLTEMLFISIAIAVASIPEGLPAAVTIILAIGMEALLKRGGLVRNLLAAETLGSTTYILTDKTGTLTEANMSVVGVIHNTEVDYDTERWLHDHSVRFMFETALCASDAYYDEQENKSVIRGDSVEQAILHVADELNIDAEHQSMRSLRIDYLAFSSENRYAAGLAEWGDAYQLCINGAPSLLLKNATQILTDSGEEAFTSQMREAYQEYIRTETAKGKRLVATAYKHVEYDDIPDNHETVLAELTFAGVMILDDPVRKGVEESIRGVRDAGAKVILITGDNPQTALSIAKQTGITDESGGVLTGKELEKLEDEEVISIIEDINVFARVLPHQKMRIVQILQMRGEIVAMTGDGINDAPALRRAHIGVALGAGTEVAQEASDLVLVNNSFSTIYAAIEEGRRIVANLRKVVGYLLSTSLSEVVLVGSAMIVGAATPILPAQILWANVIEEGLMSVAFAFEKGEKGAMKKKPQDIHEKGILSREMISFVVMVIVVLSSFSVALFFYLRYLGLPLDELRSVIFLAVAMDSLFISFAFRSLTTPVWKIPLHTNKFFIGSFLLSVALLITALSIPFFQHVLSYTPVDTVFIYIVVGFSALSLAIVEIGKWIFFERRD